MCKENDNIVTLVADIISAYLANQTIGASEVPELIKSVHGALIRLDAPATSEDRQPALTAAQIRKSITPDHIICFENGKPYRSLTRHLRAAYGLTPDEYREKWGLSPDYPMVAPNYAALRSQLARNFGLGAVPVEKKRAAEMRELRKA